MILIKDAKINREDIAILRTDWNVPFSDGKIIGFSRITNSIETIKYLKNNGLKVIIISHFGRKGDSLKPVYDYFSKEYGSEFKNTYFITDIFSQETKDKITKSEDGSIFVFENIRMWEEEEKNDEKFAQKISGLGNIYINDAFSSSHREHASIVGIPKYLPHYAGLRFMEEYSKISEVFNPEHPFLFILGGAKFETKLPLVENFLNIADCIFIGGANAKTASTMDIAKNPKIILPVGDIEALDANIETLEILESKIKEAKFILWNGPLGNYEKGYTEGTQKLAKMLGESNAKVITGGGDTETVISNININKPFYFTSLAGGAMLDFLIHKTLPGIEALDKIT